MDYRIPPVRSFLATLRHRPADTLMSSSYTRATLLQLTNGLGRAVLASNHGALLYGSVSSGPWPSFTASEETLVCALPMRHDTTPGLLLFGISAHISAVVCAISEGAHEGDEEARIFQVAWSCHPATVDYALTLLEHSLESSQHSARETLLAARHHTPLHAPDPTLIAQLSSQIITFASEQHHQLSQRIRGLTQQIQWQDDQSRMVVHDMRAPLHTLKMSIRAMLGHRLAPEVETELLQVADESVQALLNLTETMLDASRLEYGNWPLRLQPLRIRTLVQSVCEPLLLVPNPDRAKLDYTAPDDLPVIWTDKRLLERVMTNLITNAFKYTQADGHINVTAQLTEDGQAIELLVSDTGKGISLEAQHHIFDRYFQATDGERHPGVGLGLYFCRLATQVLGGTITVFSTPQVGSIFTVRLPVVNPGEAPPR